MRKAQEIPVPAEFITGRKEQASSRGSLAVGDGSLLQEMRGTQKALKCFRKRSLNKHTATAAGLL